MVCSFTGHRPDKLLVGERPNEKAFLLKEALKNEIIKKINAGADVFMTGMALGADTLAAEAVLELKSEYSGIKLVAVIPCAEQDRFWSTANKRRYAFLLSQCDETTVLQEKYTVACMHIRNKYLIDHADVLIAVWDGSPGGTANTVALARKKGIPVSVIDPSAL